MRASVIDSFDISGRVAVDYGATGAVVIFSPSDPADPPVTGERVLVVRPDGWMRPAVIGEVKLAPGAPGFFVIGLTKAQVPIGTALLWGESLARPVLDVAEPMSAAG